MEASDWLNGITIRKLKGRHFLSSSSGNYSVFIVGVKKEKSNNNPERGRKEETEEDKRGGGREGEGKQK